jgi:hypothetical protein
MKESYGEGLANHTSLESCGNCSNAMAEALAEGRNGMGDRYFIVDIDAYCE